MYPLTGDAGILRSGFSKIFSLCFDGPRVPRDSGCLASAAERPQVVKEKLAKEIKGVLLVHLSTCNVLQLGLLPCSPCVTRLAFFTGFTQCFCFGGYSCK